jgi:DNA-binding HxlR family transcriptional regulator
MSKFIRVIVDILINFAQSWGQYIYPTISQKNMTTQKEELITESCPIEGLLKMLSGKWKPQIFQLAQEQPVRFNSLLRQLPEANKQSISVALKELEEAGLLVKNVVQLKPLHIEYVLSEKGILVIPIFRQLEGLVE